MSESGVPQAGQAAPTFRADSSTGPIALDQFRGQNVVLYFFPKADTAG